jgi:hypothetical protein
VRTDDVVAPIGGVTGFVPKSNVMPCGGSEIVRFTGEKNTPSDWTVIVELADPPGAIVRDDGEVVSVKSAKPAAMVTSRFTLWISGPLVPFI